MPDQDRTSGLLQNLHDVVATAMHQYCHRISIQADAAALSSNLNDRPHRDAALPVARA